MARVAAHGQVCRVEPGEVLFEAGDQVVPFFVVTAGQVEIIQPYGTTETLVAVHRPGQFTGEVTMLSGRRPLVRARASASGEVIQRARDHGAGVYYGATCVAAQWCGGEEVIVVRPYTVITALDGGDHLERVHWRDQQTGTSETHAIRHIFAMTRAVPNTRWLEGCVALDAQGFIKTGPDLSPEDLAAARWPLARPPHRLETSLPGVFAVGDVRGGNIKRVASAVGEGSIAVAFVHQVLRE